MARIERDCNLKNLAKFPLVLWQKSQLQIMVCFRKWFDVFVSVF